MIGVIDYGVGNLASIINMFRRAGVKAHRCSDPDAITAAAKLLLPGVGSFDHCLRSFEASGLPGPVTEAVEAGKPLLGICVGMQMLTRGSEEGGLPGLGWLDAKTRRFQIDASSGLKVPHMGWNDVRVSRTNPLLDRGEQRFYFLHSYHVVCDDRDDVIGEATHGYPFACAVARGNVFGVQFHPEKSHRFGLQLFRNFAAL